MEKEVSWNADVGGRRQARHPVNPNLIVGREQNLVLNLERGRD